jgi:hypothetical protein
MKVDDLIGHLRGAFKSIKDHRASNCQYSLSDNLMAGFTLFHQKDPSLLAFREQFPGRAANLRSIYGLESIPEDTAFRGCLDGIEPDLLQASFHKLLQLVSDGGILDSKRVLGDRLIVSFDGTGYFSSTSICCPQCLVKEHRNGVCTYHHQMLAAALVHPHQETVQVVFAEPIVNTNGKIKNDCERNAFKRLLPKVGHLLPNESIVAVLDALYADGPTVRALQEACMDFLIGIKEGYVLVQVETLRAKNQLQELICSDNKIRTTFRWANSLILNGANRDVMVNYLECEQTDISSGKIVFKNTWITNLDLEQDNVQQITTVARSRWKIENETFNTLKNQGYHLEHNFGHGKKFLSSVFALLMLLAFNVDQLAQTADESFKKALAKFKTRQGFFKRTAAVFDIIPSMSMNAIYRFISGEIDIGIPSLE